MIVAADAHHRFGAAVRNRSEHRREPLVIHRTMLGIHEQPVVARVRELLSDRWAVGIEKQAELGAAFAKLLLEIGAGYGGFGHGSLLIRRIAYGKSVLESIHRGEM